jgi:hypothetical protein
VECLIREQKHSSDQDRLAGCVFIVQEWAETNNKHHNLKNASFRANRDPEPFIDVK